MLVTNTSQSFTYTPQAQAAGKLNAEARGVPAEGNSSPDQGAAAPQTQGAIQALEEAAKPENNKGNPAETLANGILSSGLSEEEQKHVQELKKIDAEVRAHEQSHKNVAGPYAGPISYETVTGPDGQEYAVGGEVDIDAAPVSGNPQATIEKLETVLRAALAPSQPSPQDFAVARAAQQGLAQARKELQEQREAEQEALRDKKGENLNEIEVEKFDPSQNNSDILSAIQSLTNTAQLSEQSAKNFIQIET